MLKLALIGMSGSGKTFWANKLAGCGYRLISCDDRIEQKLAAELSAAGYRGIGGVAAWMGWPDTTAYRDREQKYLQCEIEVIREILAELARAHEEKIVVDTTGSVIYTGKEFCQELRQQATVVYLEASPEEQATLIDRYLRDPKPVLWREQFQQRKEETPRNSSNTAGPCMKSWPTASCQFPICGALILAATISFASSKNRLTPRDEIPEHQPSMP